MNDTATLNEREAIINAVAIVVKAVLTCGWQITNIQKSPRSDTHYIVFYGGRTEGGDCFSYTNWKLRVSDHPFPGRKEDNDNDLFINTTVEHDCESVTEMLFKMINGFYKRRY